VRLTELGCRNEVTRRTPRRAQARRALESERRCFWGRRRPGDGASRPRRIVRRAPGPQGSDAEGRISRHRSPLAPSSDFDEERNPMRAGPPGDRRAHHRPAPARGQVTELARLTQVRRAGVHPATGDQTELREGHGRQLASQGAGPGERFDVSVFEVQRRAPLSRGSFREGQGGAGCRRRGGTGKTPVRCGLRVARTELAAGAHDAREALCELGCRPTVTREVL